VTRVASFEPAAATFLTGTEQELSLPVWVDHVGSAGTRHAVGALERITAPPERTRLPLISPT
jgi:CRISPR-associated protein Cas5t